MLFAICGSVILVGSGLKHEGRLEILYHGVWGTVCSGDFGDEDARVFCRQLGFE